MKKLLLMGALLVTYTAQAQVVALVQAPQALEGSYDHTWADPGGGWGTADLNDPINAITGTLALVDDGTASDSLGCGALVNGGNIAGKIAVVYRGTCEFGAKAMNAQNAGAIGVVIINNSGAPVGMGPGAMGATVTIPTIMISTSSGALLRPEIDAGNVVMYIGAINGAFPVNLGIYKGDVLLPKATAIPKQLCGNATELTVPLASWIHNYGTSLQTGVTLTGDVTLSGGSVYSQTSAAQDIPAGDSVFFTLPAFSQSSYGGLYTISYTAGSAATDLNPQDDVFSTNLLIDSLFGQAYIDAQTEQTNQADFYQPASMPVNATFSSCIHFQDAHASRVAAIGLYVSCSTRTTDSLDGQYIEVSAQQWNDPISGVGDATFNSLLPVASGEYVYSSNALQHETLYVPFQQGVVLMDNQRYLFCLTSLNNIIFHGFDNKLSYDENYLANDQPHTCISDDGTWYANGFGVDVPSAVAVRFVDAEDVGIAEDVKPGSITPYPNPTSDLLQIPLAGRTGKADLTITELSGKVIGSQQVNMAGQTLLVDVSGIANGAYLFDLRFNDGTNARFRVVVQR